MPERATDVTTGAATTDPTGTGRKTPGQGSRASLRGDPTLSPRTATPKAGPAARAAVLEALAVVRLADTELCRRLATPDARTSRYVLVVLTELAAEGYTDSVRIDRSRRRIWFLTGRGQSAAADLTGQRARRRSWAALARSRAVHHALAVTATVAALTPAGAGLDSWTLERPHAYGPGAADRFIADAALARTVRTTDDVPPVLLIEVDRGTESHDRLGRKLEAYAEYAATTRPLHSLTRGRRRAPAYQIDYPGTERCPPLLVVFAGITNAAVVSRGRALVQISRGLRRAYGLDIGFTKLETLLRRGVGAEIVVPAYASRYRAKALIDLPRETASGW